MHNNHMKTGRKLSETASKSENQDPVHQFDTTTSGVGVTASSNACPLGADSPEHCSLPHQALTNLQYSIIHSLITTIMPSLHPRTATSCAKLNNQHSVLNIQHKASKINPIHIISNP
ncbi:hypothetical protein AcW1_010200 [Taiwanofungus camphoratus]|nr:hypothetical protein AcW1_010200 [Antrodia cinnamomea]